MYNTFGILSTISDIGDSDLSDVEAGALKMQDKTLQGRTMTDKRSTMPE